ncbi:STAS domain-containing protein [Lederbergia wuyishanensis]|uniref:RsbT co-antagonist protein RsbR n=1 Tax=Lederbergia wuyishanensis TaxID=1347903 RepID=A0ABU0D6M8_9BACI|nr:STAS domain-containing protein [Lederbergia wuyishanensis]MCJ8008593.1 STAS domain-containing protein [Lederbergia wuyishanensis]MDQ0343991.1 rsbT co-antagonist protein RsbR [Lederbergia wuyishanensis]
MEKIKSFNVLFGEYIIENSYQAAVHLNETFDKNFVDSFVNPQQMEILNKWRADFLVLLGKAVKQNDKESIWESITEWAKLSGTAAVNFQLSLDDALKTLTSWRTVLWDMMDEIIQEHNVRAGEVVAINRILDPLIDHAGYVFSVSFVDNHRKTLELAQKAIQEYSVPVVSLTDEIAILPLIGDLDTHRAKILKENTLNSCSKLENQFLIIDLSGVPMMDTMVANELFQVISSLKLIGVETILTGLRPEIAQAIVHLGISFEGVLVEKGLKNALETLRKVHNM